MLPVCHHLTVLLCPKTSHTATIIIIKIGGELLIYQNHLAVSFVTVWLKHLFYSFYLQGHQSSAGFKLDKWNKHLQIYSIAVMLSCVSIQEYFNAASQIKKKAIFLYSGAHVL